MIPDGRSSNFIPSKLPVLKDTRIQYNRIVESVAKLVAKVEIAEDTTFVSKTESVSVAAYKPPTTPPSGGGGEEVSGDITATFEAEGTDIMFVSLDFVLFSFHVCSC